MGQELPLWLSDEFFVTILERDEGNEDVTIVKFSAKPAVGAGENYTSTIWRVHVEYETALSSGPISESLMIKAPLEKGFINDFSTEVDFFETEPLVYGKLLPKMYEISKFRFGPKSFYCPLKNGLVLKDMKAEGYVMCDRFEHLDFSHCKLVFTTLARYHATSVACYNEDPELIKSIGDERIFVAEGPMVDQLEPWLRVSIKKVTSILKEIEGHQSFADSLSDKADKMWENTVNVCKPKKSGLNVLNHGDCWTNNMLFKHDESGEPIDLKLIDFQISRRGSPVLDLIYFLWSSAKGEVRESKQKDLYNIYLETLNDTLKDLGCEERFTHEELEEDLKSASNWILYTICFVLPFIICNPEDALDISSFSSEDVQHIETDERFLKMYDGPHFKTILPDIIRQYRACL